MGICKSMSFLWMRDWIALTTATQGRDTQDTQAGAAVWTVASLCTPSPFMHKHLMVMVVVKMVMEVVRMSWLFIDGNVTKQFATRPQHQHLWANRNSKESKFLVLLCSDMVVFSIHGHTVYQEATRPTFVSKQTIKGVNRDSSVSFASSIALLQTGDKHLILIHPFQDWEQSKHLKILVQFVGLTKSCCVFHL